VLGRYGALREVVWLQEEPRNMGAWGYVAPRIRELLSPDVALLYCGRDASASPAEGSLSGHQAEQARLLRAAVEGLPEPELAK
jgi:2-oxoglutarate dehydrogenase E1 component